jgi:fructokinase
MKPEDLNKEYIRNAQVVNFGSVTLLMEPSRSATLAALDIAKGNSTISCDVNFRLDIWRHKMDEMWALADQALANVDILKLGQDEAIYLGSHINPKTKDPTLDEALEAIYTRYDPRLIAVTRGGKGSRLILIKNHQVQEDLSQAVYKVVAQDTVGAGDAFFGSLLYMLLRMGRVRSLDLTQEDLKRIMTFCNTYAALSTARKGAWNLPQIKDIMYIPEISENYIK